jgi:hypothetical protein
MSASPPAFGLSRTCSLTDFPGVVTVAGWQQAMADLAWAQWCDEYHIRSREQTICDNYSGCAFQAPGPHPLYRYPGQRENGQITRAVPALFGLCVLDRIEAPVGYLQRAARVLRAKGLLFLTFAFWNAEGEDVAAGHEARARIYEAHSMKKLMAESRRLGFQTFGGTDWRYHGNKLDDHTLASLVLTRR